MPNIIFKNNTDLPILVRTWIEPMKGIRIMNHVYCSPHTIMEIYSKDDEWYIDNLFGEKKDFDAWNDKGYKIRGHLGKIQLQPLHNRYTIHMFSKEFECVQKNGIFIFSISSENP
jgi:hypothetical protein